MEWVVTTGRSIEEAVDAALDELGVDEPDAEIEVLAEPRQGLFGRLRGEARVRARVRPTTPRPKIDRRDRRRRSGAERARGRGDGAAAARSASRTAAGATAPPPATGPMVEGERGSAAPGPGEASPSGAGRPAAAGPDEARPRSRRRRRSRGRGGATREGAREAEEAGLEAGEEEPTVIDDDVSLAEQGEAARAFLEGLLQRFGLAVEVEVVELDEDTVEVRVTGHELGLLIGQKGQTLSAVQELTRAAVQQTLGGRAGRLLVDIAGYRQRRKEALERFTRGIAEDVAQSGVQKVLEPMNPADRKVVHDTVNEIDGVRTTSEGEEPNRRVVILPDRAGQPA